MYSAVKYLIIVLKLTAKIIGSCTFYGYLLEKMFKKAAVKIFTFYGKIEY